jgi:hypothetical protein
MDVVVEEEEEEVYVPADAVMPALRAALAPYVDEALLGTVPPPERRKRAVPMGELVRWWFEVGWPRMRQMELEEAEGGIEGGADGERGGSAEVDEALAPPIEVS